MATKRTDAQAEVRVRVGAGEVEAALAEARAAGAAWVHLVEAADVGSLLRAAAAAAAAGLRCVTEGLPSDVDTDGLLALANGGVARIRLLRAVEAALEAALIAAGIVGPRRVVVAPAEDAETAVACAARWGADVALEGRRADDDRVRDALDRALPAALAADLDLRLSGVVLPPPVPAPPDGAPLPVGRALLGVVREGISLPCFARGARVGPGTEAAAAVLGSRRQLGRLLGAVGVPVHDLPRCEGGLGRGAGPRCPACPGGAACGGAPGVADDALLSWAPLEPGQRVVVVLGPVSDRLAVASWPGLVDALCAEGLHARLVSAWHAPVNPAAPPPVADPSALDEVPAAKAWAQQHVADFARGLDLGDADVVIVSGLDWGDVVLRHPSLPRHARVIVADDHLGQGLGSWVARWRKAVTGGLGAPWHLDGRATFVSGFPRFAHLYALPGLPLDRVDWRLYPLDARVLPAAVPVTEAGVILAGGNHLRRHDLLGEAVARLGDGRPVQFVGAGRPRLVAPRLGVEPPLPLGAFVARIAASRFVVVPAAHVPERSAGNSVISIAQALGRPVIATATPAALDHLTHGVDGLVVPQDDPAALAAAIDHLDRDDALVARLAEGALAAGRRADVAAWARRLVRGGPAPAPGEGAIDGPGRAGVRGPT